MTSQLALLLLLLTTPSSSETLDSLGHAPPSMVARLSHEFVGKDRVRITTTGTRYEVRVGRLDAEGLGGFKTRGSAPRPPDPLAWPSVARIDAVRSRHLPGLVVGFAAGGLIGLPFSFGEGGGQGGAIFALSAVAGGWIGGRIGSNMVRERPLYVSQPRTESRPPPEPAAAATAVAVPDLASRLPGEAAPGSIYEPAMPRIRRATAKIRPNRLLRVTFSDMTRIEGYASQADDAGLHALRTNRAFGSVPPLPDVVPWTRISRVERRGGSAGRSALVGGLSLGVLGGVVGMAAGAFGGTGSTVAAGAAIGGLGFGALGAGLGAAIGAPIPRWHEIY